MKVKNVVLVMAFFTLNFVVIAGELSLQDTSCEKISGSLSRDGSAKLVKSFDENESVKETSAGQEK
jgi:hypothetical protein